MCQSLSQFNHINFQPHPVSPRKQPSHLATSTGPDGLLLRLNATRICHSDIHYMLEDLPMPTMRDYGVRSPGHEGAGVVVALGSNVKN